MKLLFGSSKGGVGKTTNALHLAVQQHYKGRRVGILKADKNRDITGWAQRRSEAGAPSIAIHEAYGNIAGEIEKLAPLYEVLIIDAAGHDSAEFRSALTCVDYLISPVCPASCLETDNLYDLSVITNDAKRLANPGLKAGILFTRVANSGSEAAELAKSLQADKSFIQPFKQRISELKVYRLSINAGVGVHELERASSLGKAKGQIELLAKELGL